MIVIDTVFKISSYSDFDKCNIAKTEKSAILLRITSLEDKKTDSVLR